MRSPDLQCAFAVRDYDLALTLESGQAFRWTRAGDRWQGVISGRWVRLVQSGESIVATAAEPQPGWGWLEDYLQLGVDLDRVIGTFPSEEPLARAVAACRGLRLLRQDPWECLVSFILSSSKQIVQIRQMVAALCERFGERVPCPPGEAAAWSFPAPEALAAAGERELRACKLGFRAPYVRETSRIIESGGLRLEQVGALELDAAREKLMELPGVGRKVADCVLLFAYGFARAFPVDVWVTRALQQLYFPRRRVSPGRLRDFAATHFGPCGGYAQQYLFHHMRTAGRAADGLSAVKDSK